MLLGTKPTEQYYACCQAVQKANGISIYSSKFRTKALRQKSLHRSVQSHLYWESCEIVYDICRLKKELSMVQNC